MLKLLHVRLFNEMNVTHNIKNTIELHYLIALEYLKEHKIMECENNCRIAYNMCKKYKMIRIDVVDLLLRVFQMTGDKEQYRIFLKAKLKLLELLEEKVPTTVISEE